MSKKKKKNKVKIAAKGGASAEELYAFIAAKPAKGVSLKNILKWAVAQDGGEGIFDTLEELIAKKRIQEDAPDHFRALLQVSTINTLIGVVDMTQSGNAYVVIDGHLYDVFVPARKTMRAFNGDTVRVRITSHGKNKKPEGEIVEIIKREKELFVGEVHLHDNFAFAVTDSRFNNYDFYLSPEEVKKHALEHGDRVIIRLRDWPPSMKNPIGQVVSKLGKAGEHESDMQAIMVETGVPLTFPAEVEEEADKIPVEITEDIIAARRDMRKVLTFTIDPYDAKDFDDAISYRTLKDDRVEVGVHIADVSYYVTPKTAIDKEAYSRGTSVYLVDRVMPMLPEKLSNNVCSLRPHEEKLCFSAIFEMDMQGNVHSEWFGRTVIYSDRRFTYEEAQEVLEKKEGDHAEELLALNTIAHALRDKKFAHGAITFETLEVKFILDEKKVPTGVFVKERKDAHMLIEDLMLLANKKVAAFLAKKHPKVPFVYRVHDTPDPDKLKDFGMTAKRFGYKLKLDSPKQVSAELNHLMKEIKGKPEQNILENMAIRCMAKAVYTTKNIGHYGLAFDHYTHFTSPIRRYPDLLVHRILNDVLEQNKLLYPKQEDLEDLCRHSSAMERKAMEAERESVRYKQVEYMSKHVGETFDGVISGITPYGIFVEISENKCEGMIHIDNIRDELTYDEARKRHVSLTKGRNYELGDKITIKVRKADMEKRQLDFIPEE